jgi:hypothetical protein
VASAITVTDARPKGRSVGLRPLAALPLVALLGAVTWLVTAAAQQPIVLSPPAHRARGGAGWMLGPFQALDTHVSSVPQELHSDVVRVLVIVGGAWLLAWVTAPALPVRVVAGAVVLVHGVLFLSPPLSLTDVFNYELYGRMAALDGLNPYRAVPAQAATDPLYHLANWHHLRSPYGPLFTVTSEGLTVFGIHGWYWAWKVVVAMSSLGSVALVAALAGRLGVSRQRAIAAVGLCPVLLISEVGGLHQDMLAMVCLLGAAWCLMRGRDADAPGWAAPAAGALAVAAAGIKPSFVLVVGIVVLAARQRPRAIAGAAAAGAALGAVVLALYGGALPDVSTQSRLVSPLSIPNLVGLAAGHGGADQAVRSAFQAVLVLVAAGATAAVAVRREWALSALGALLFCSVLTLSWVMPWYLIWSLPFIALARPRLLAPPAAVAACWLMIGGLPTVPGILHSAGYYPTRLDTGRANHEAFHRLVR